MNRSYTRTRPACLLHLFTRTDETFPLVLVYSCLAPIGGGSWSGEAPVSGRPMVVHNGLEVSCPAW